MSKIRGNARPRSQLRDWVYTPAGLQMIEERTLRKEYTRLRDISQKRLKRLKAAGYGGTQTYLYNVNRFKKIRDIKSPAELRHLLSDLAYFINSQTSTVAGIHEQEEQMLAALHQHEQYAFVTRENLAAFGQFMEYYRTLMGEYLYDSERAAEEANKMLAEGLDPEQMEERFKRFTDVMIATGDIQHREPQSSKRLRGGLL